MFKLRQIGIIIDQLQSILYFYLCTIRYYYASLPLASLMYKYHQNDCYSKHDIIAKTDIFKFEYLVFMRNNRFNSNDSLFSLDYKIPYEKSSIESHLEESQEEINFIKVKLTEAYQKLEIEIRNNTEMEEQLEHIGKRNKELEEKLNYEKKENGKLKETLEVILKNRRIMQEQAEEVRQNWSKKCGQKQKMIEELQKEIKALASKNSTLTAQNDEKTRLIRDYSERFKQQSMLKDQDCQRQSALTHKIQFLQNQIAKITQQKFIQINRLRHELQLYSSNPIQSKQIRIQQRPMRIEPMRVDEKRRRDFSRPSVNRQQPKFDTKASDDTDSQLNKENMHSFQLNMVSQSMTDSSVSKWKRGPSNKEVHIEGNSSSIQAQVTDDQMLFQYQMSRKKAQQELCSLQRIKRPSNQDREKITRLQRQIYHLDSDIAALKRKIRRKY